MDAKDRPCLNVPEQQTQETIEAKTVFDKKIGSAPVGLRIFVKTMYFFTELWRNIMGYMGIVMVADNSTTAIT
mgnify:CR=1 FL=1